MFCRFFPPDARRRPGPVSIGVRFRRFSWGMGLAVVILTSGLLYLQSGLQTELAALQDEFMPRWRTAQRLHSDAQAISAKTAQLTLAFTPGELQSIREELDDQILAFETSLQAVIEQITHAELARNLVVAAGDFRREADVLAEAVRRRATAADALTASQMERERRKERDLARLVDDQVVTLASYTSALAADIEIAFAEHRRELSRRLWLQVFCIGLAGALIGGLIWRQFHLLDHWLIRRIKALEADMAKTELDQNLLARNGATDEIDAMRNELAGLLKRLTAQNSELTRLATTDSLTGLANRRCLFECLEQEVYRARRYGAALALILFDIDHFKRVNDGWGHAAGDQALREIAHELHDLLRKTDTAGRYGGEEFLVLLPETDLAEAAALARRLNRQIARRTIALGHSSFSVTISAGVAALAPEEAGESLIHRADQALYRAKQEGRNRIEIATAPAGLARQEPADQEPANPESPDRGSRDQVPALAPPRFPVEP